MDDWEDHAQQVRDRGLIGYYHANSFANHPPFISEVGSLILRVSTATHVPFRILFRGGEQTVAIQVDDKVVEIPIVEFG